MTDNKTPVWVTIAINIGGETKAFEVDANAANDPYDVASGLLDGLHTDAGRWLRNTGIELRRTF